VLKIKARRNTNEPGKELTLLRARARDIEARLDRLNRRLAEIQPRSDISWPIAVIDKEICLGCGICEAACPFEAIAVNEIAAVTPSLCNGCGRCAAECPQAAITLAPRTRPGSENKNK
jgi:MinD superfamily P-loop ATPase